MAVIDRHEEVSVQLTGAPEDADAVFAALLAAYPCDRDAAEHPHREGRGDHPTVWSATYDVASPDTAGPVAATALRAPVGAELSGSYAAVDRLARAMTTGFAVEVEHAVSGDGEKQLRLRLDSPSTAGG
ncbi:hypothetical protein SSP531S_09000 [Streptomyces spongiicola]|uniref:Uncharacterized protein n=1 Tax=Streptomyces spongiicola TaxID=1690221 RepID=A0A388SST5_9ACTN|nr:hypothetical protein [Streptomyces spongiicola]GBP99505.1 hypothetical protein SSP531S_09000 [Streptomyces spongiicola]